jgi:hypothetical protein
VCTCRLFTIHCFPHWRPHSIRIRHHHLPCRCCGRYFLALNNASTALSPTIDTGKAWRGLSGPAGSKTDRDDKDLAAIEDAPFCRDALLLMVDRLLCCKNGRVRVRPISGPAALPQRDDVDAFVLGPCWAVAVGMIVVADGRLRPFLKRGRCHIM